MEFSTKFEAIIPASDPVCHFACKLLFYQLANVSLQIDQK